MERHDVSVAGRGDWLRPRVWGRERGLAAGPGRGAEAAEVGEEAGGEAGLGLPTHVVQRLAGAQVGVVPPAQVKGLHLLLDVEVTRRGPGPRVLRLLVPGPGLGPVQHVFGDLQLPLLAPAASEHA